MTLAKPVIAAPLGGSLCDSCVHARAIRGHAEPEVINICNQQCEPIVVPFAVKSCPSYRQHRMLDTQRLTSLNWELRLSHPGSADEFIVASAEIDLNKVTEDA